MTPAERRPRTARISTAPPSGRKVIQESSAEVVGWSMSLPESQELADSVGEVGLDVEQDDEGDAAAQRAEEVALNVAGLQAAELLAAVPGKRAEPVDGAVDDVLVDGRVEVGDRAGEEAHEVDQAVDEVLVDPVGDAPEYQRAAHHRRAVELVDVVLVEDERPGAREHFLQARRRGALVVEVEHA